MHKYSIISLMSIIFITILNFKFCISTKINNNFPSSSIIPFNSRSSSHHRKLTPRIINGKIAKPHEFPYQVALKSSVLQFGGLSTSCGGSLISTEYVLTAAHCIYTFFYEQLENGTITVDFNKRSWVYDIDVILGAHNLKKAKDEGQQKFNLHVSRAKIHPKYNPYTSRNDIALIKLPQAVKLNDKIQTIKLPSRSLPNLVGETLIASGWGFTNETTKKDSEALRYTKTQVYDFDFCKKEDLGYDHDDKTIICSYNPYGSASCFGDSGGPNVFLTENGTKILVGITSFHNYKGCGVSPSALTRVSSYLDWILEETGI